MPGAGNQTYPAQQISKYEEGNLIKMKRKHLLHFLLVALLIVTFVAVFAISASAETPAETDVFEVLNASGEHVAYAETLDAAKTSMTAGYTLKVLKNATVDLALDLDYAYNLDATGVTVTGVVAQSKGTVTVKGGTFTTSGETALWTMTGASTNLTVEDAAFISTHAGNTKADSTVGAVFVFNQIAGNVNVQKGSLTANGTLFYWKALKVNDKDVTTKVNLTVGADVNGTSKKFGIYVQWNCGGDITFNGGNWEAGRVAHICGGRNANSTGTLTYNGGNYHSLYISDASAKTGDYRAKCLVQNDNDYGGLYVNNYGLTVTGGEFTFDGAGIAFVGATGAIKISGGSFKTTQTDTSVTDRQAMLFMQGATNKGNSISNATFEAYSSKGHNNTVRGVVWGDIGVYIVFGEGTKVIAHGAATAVHMCGAPDKTVIFNGGTYTSETGMAYQDSGANPMVTAATGGIYFNGGTFSSGIVGDNGVVVMQSGAYYEINGAAFANTNKDNAQNVIFRAMRCAAVVIKKGTFTGGTFMRIRGDGTSADKSALVIIDPEKDEDVKFEYAYTRGNPMFWFEGDKRIAPTLIIKGGIFSRPGTGYIFAANNGCNGNVYVLGGQFTAAKGDIFGIWTHNSFNIHILGGNFIAGMNFINHAPGTASKGAESKVTINIYGKGETVSLNLPAFNDFGNRAVKEANLTSGTVVSAGVYAEGRIILVNTEGYTTSQNALNIYGGTYVIRNGGEYNIINLATNSMVAVNIYGGTFRNLGGTSRFIKSEGGKNTVNFYGGTFSTENTICQEFIAFNGKNLISYDVVTFWGAGVYNGITTDGVTITHVGRKSSNSALLITCDGSKNEIKVTVKGGTFKYTSIAGNSNMFFSWNSKYDLLIEGGTFEGDTTFSRNYGSSNIVVKNATISMTSGAKSLFMDGLNITGKSYLDLENTTSGTFTFYRGTKYEITGEWTSFASAGSENNVGKFETADTTGVVSGFPCSTIEEAFQFIGEETPSIVLLGDVLLNTTLRVDKNLIIDGKGFAIHATCNPFEVADGVTLTIVNAVIEDDAMFLLASGNVVLKNCTLKLFGTREMIRLSANASLTLENCTLTSPLYSTLPDNDTVYNGCYILLFNDFKGNVTIKGGSVTNGSKLIFSYGNSSAGADGTVNVTDMTFAVDQFVVYDMWTCGTSYTFTNCTAEGGRVPKLLHICADDTKTYNKNAEYTVNGGNYETSANFVYVGAYRVGTMNLNNVTASTTEASKSPTIHVSSITLNITGGTYTQNGNYSVLLYYAPKVETTGERDLATATIKNASLISYHGVVQDKTKWYYESAVMLSCGVRATLENCTVKSLGKKIDGKQVTVGYAVGIDGGAECIITGDNGYYSTIDANVISIATDNAYGRLTINGGTFTMEDMTVSAARSLVWNAGGVTTINGGNFTMPKFKVENNGVMIGGSKGSAAQQTTFVINGGNYFANNNTDATVSADGADITINGGYFTSMGMCVARVLGGKTGNEANGVVTEASKALLTIKGGVFVLKEGGRSADYVAVVRAGGGTTYGTINISGGTFINERGNEKNATVIFKNNAASSMSVTGGTFLIKAPTKTGIRSFFYRSNGYVDSVAGNGTVANTPTCNITVFGEALSKTENAEATVVAHASALYNTGIYYVSGKISGYADILLDGAQARLRTGANGQSGLRFVSTFSAELVKELEAKAKAAGEELVYGTIITATKSLLNDKYPLSFTLKYLQDNNKTYIDKPAEKGLTVNEDGSVTIRFALVDIRPENYELSFSAISYAKIGDDYYYSNYDFGANARSIADVAAMALADKKGSLPCYDETGVATGESTSRYTKDEQKQLYKYLGKEWA